MKLIVHFLLSGLAVFVAARVLPGVTVDGYGTALIVAVVLGVANTVLKPILLLLTLPINIMTLGLFTFVIIGGLVELAAALVPGFHVAGFLWALAFAFVLAVLNAIFHGLESAA
jgi:putative membrane protein